MKRADLLKELEHVRVANGGFLTPEAVVESAKDENSPLHPFFDWDDTEAARKWRIVQARRLIRLSVTVIKPEVEPVRAFVSLPKDRGVNGYRSTVQVLSDEDLREQLLECALRELQAFRRKYAMLSALKELFEVADRILSGNVEGSGGDVVEDVTGLAAKSTEAGSSPMML